MESSRTIPIVLNGEPRQVPEGLTVAALLAHLGVAGDKVAVELNRAIVRRTEWSDTAVAAGAALEVVQFVGGG